MEDPREAFLPCATLTLEMKLGKLVMVALAAGVLSLRPIDGAEAAKSGCRVGGQVFRSATQSFGPRINNLT
jgi:uncharacterized membrane protein